MVSLWLFGEEKVKDFAKLNWDLPREEMKPVSPILQGEFLTTGPPEKP